MTLESHPRILELQKTRDALAASIATPDGDFLLKTETKGIFDPYRELGAFYKDLIREALDKIALDNENLPKRIHRAERVMSKLRNVVSLETEFSEPIEDCLYALWGYSDGAELDDWCAKNGIGSSIIAALMLQDDNTFGCQTAMFRVSKDVVIMTHTEEDNDITSKMTKAHAIEID